MEFDYLGRHIEVIKSSGHPSGYVYITIDGRQFFLSIVPDGATRWEVKKLAWKWLREHPNALDTSTPK